MKKNIVVQNELVQVKGRVKAITIKKEDFNEFLKLTTLRVFDKSYDVLMPPIDDMKKNTIDLNGLAIIIQNYFASLVYTTGSQSSPGSAEIVLSTSSGSPVTLQYSGQVKQNTQGVTVLPQIFGASGNLTFQYYFIGFDTTNSSYSATQAELYASAWVSGSSGVPFQPDQENLYTLYTPLVRIAYTNISITKSSTEYLFLVWLIEFENVPSYASFAIPIFQNALNLIADILQPTPNNSPPPSSVTIYFYNGNCNFTCGGNCPNGGLNGFVVYTQNNALVVEFPLQAPLQGGISSPQVLICTTVNFNNRGGASATITGPIPGVASISGSESTTVTPPVSGATFYVAIVTISITFTAS
ncbi:SIFV.gp60-like protein [Sulfolobus islandicus filamentous virus 2]|uniref:SIFV.gp60-like protein n=1 Tax=Sulfolobus islandicus filamentous virus 2 TaxID=1902331 RepID=A0A1D8BJA7_SIFV|nr:SIFV.gp60-like protein [Sulfolobus islandicus filamentous virus 2]